jgi:GNAT superfamily N-acetyltransferase
MQVQRLGVDEGPRLRSIRLRALRDAPDAFGTTWREAQTWPPDRWHSQLQTIPTFVALHDGADVGLVRAVEHAEEDDAGFLISMWVAPASRCQGVGEALVDAVISWARARGLHRVYLHVTDQNHAAIRLYAKKGFEPTGVTNAFDPPREHIREHQRVLHLP